MAKLRYLQNSFITAGKGLKFLLKDTGTADISQTRLGCKSPELKEGVRVTRHSSTSCPHQLDVIAATLLPSAATRLDSCFSVSSACSNHVSRSFNQMTLFWWRFTVVPVSPNSSPVCYLLAADSFSTFHHHNICDVETNSSVWVTIKSPVSASARCSEEQGT